MNILECQLCGFVARNCSQLTGHLRCSHGVWKKDQEWYFIRFIQYYLKDFQNGFCKWCGLPTKFGTITTGFQTFCDHSCRAYFESTVRNPLDKPGARKRLSNAHKKIAHIQADRVRGDKNPMKQPEVTKKVQATMEKNGHPTRGKTYEQIYGVEKAKELRSKMMNRPEIIEELRNRMLNGGAAYLNSFIKNPSKPQTELYKRCKSIFSDAVLNFPCLNYSIDVAIPSYWVAIEYDGSYWHQDNEKDQHRQFRIEQEGWSFLRYLDYVPTVEELDHDINCLRR